MLNTVIVSPFAIQRGSSEMAHAAGLIVRDSARQIGGAAHRERTVSKHGFLKRNAEEQDGSAWSLRFELKQAPAAAEGHGLTCLHK